MLVYENYKYNQVYMQEEKQTVTISISRPNGESRISITGTYDELQNKEWFDIVTNLIDDVK